MLDYSYPLNPDEIRQLIEQRVTEIVKALDETPATNAIVEALSLLILSAYAAQAGSVGSSNKETIADWIRDCEKAWFNAQNLVVPSRLQWMKDL